MKWFSRKLLVFIVGSAFLGFGFIDQSTWLILSGTYIGGQTVVDLIKNYGENRRKS